MSTPDQPTPPLTRRQLRELRNTASNPVISPEEAADAAQEAARAADAPAEPAPAEPAPAEPAPEGVVEDAVTIEADTSAVAEAPFEQAGPAVDGSSAAPATELPAAVSELEGLPVTTRRQARQRERLRTAQLGIVSSEDAAASMWAPPTEHDAGDDEPSRAEPPLIDGFPGDAAAGAPVAEEPEDIVVEEPAEEREVDDVEPETVEVEPEVLEEIEAESASDDDAAPAIAPELGAHLLEAPRVEVELPASFDSLLTRGSGSASAQNALILSETPETGSLSVPLTATGELLVTGSYALPDRYGSTGSAPGTADGKEIDATLVDGELPAASSPTPIAASAAVSTIKSAEDIIRPPAPEKGSRLMMALAVTAGVLAVALAGVLILALVNGVF